jgi:hypothetical protein
MKRFLLSIGAATVLSFTAFGASERVIGVVQPEIRLGDGTIFKNARVLDASRERNSVTISDGRRLRTLSLNALPTSLREGVIDDLARGYGRRHNVYREVRPAPPADKVVLPAPPAPNPHAPPMPPSVTDQLIARATTDAADELKLSLLKHHDPSLASLTTKVRQAEQVPGWQKIRVSGEAAYSTWDNFRRDYVWRTEKFEVDYQIVGGTSLQPDRVSFGGISRQVDID